MTIYEILRDESNEFKALGHHPAVEFAQAVKEQYGVEINIGDVKQTWEKEFFKRNRNPTKSGTWFFGKCDKWDDGSRPVTVAEVS